MNNVKTGDRIKITDGTYNNGLIGVVTEINNNVIYVESGTHKTLTANLDFCYEVLSCFENRDFLRDFVSLNKIKTTLVSKQLGKSKNWLTQAMNRTDRGDLSDQELQSIMKQLHVDWTNTQYVNVKATATHAAYRTRPCVYEHSKHKELLQRAFWDGCFVGLKA